MWDRIPILSAELTGLESYPTATGLESCPTPHAEPARCPGFPDCPARPLPRSALSRVRRPVALVVSRGGPAVGNNAGGLGRRVGSLAPVRGLGCLPGPAGLGRPHGRPAPRRVLRPVRRRIRRPEARGTPAHHERP